MGVCLSELHCDFLYKKRIEDISLQMQDQHSSIYPKALKELAGAEDEKKDTAPKEGKGKKEKDKVKRKKVGKDTSS